MFFLVGIFLDYVFPYKIKFFTNQIVIFFGLISVVLGPVIIFWAQRVSRNFKAVKGSNNIGIDKGTFSQGPYFYTKSPTNWGIFLLILGFSVLSNTIFVFGLAILSFLFSHHFFLREQESILAEKYGASYIEYKKSVKL
jgi:protein-S-isoprenylcysteine O-methyltransferase Ste14